MAVVDQVTDGLTDQMRGYGVTLEAVFFQQGAFVFDVLRGFQCGLNVEVIAPAGQLEAVVTHFFRHRCEVFEGKVGPLAGEQRDRS